MLLYWNATVWTGEPPCQDGEQAGTGGAGAAAACGPTHAEAFVVDASAGRFLFVGSVAEARRAAVAAADGAAGSSRRGAPGAGAAASDLRSAPPLEEAAAAYKAVDLEGAHVIPGIIDAHLHLIPGGLSLSRLDLSTVTSRQELASAVAAAVAGLEAGSWLLGSGWDESRWGGELPSVAWVDAGEWGGRAGAMHSMPSACLICPTHNPSTHPSKTSARPTPPVPCPPAAAPATPLLLMRHDAHMALANSAALRLAGIGPATPDPPGGSILRAADGEPSGLFTDAAMQLVSGAACLPRKA